MARQIKMLKNGEWIPWDHSDVNFLLIEEKITLSEFKNRFPKIYLNIRIKDGVRQFHKSHRKLSESQVTQIPDRYWDDDLPKAKE